MSLLGRLGMAMWWALGLLTGLEYTRRLLIPAWQGAADAGGWLQLAEAVIGLVLLALAFLAAWPAARALAAYTPAHGGAPGHPVKLAFPDKVTLVVGAVTIAIAVGCVVGLIEALTPQPGRAASGPLVCMLSAGVGSSVATLMGFLKHASEEKDFDPAYSAWYVGRPVTGALLGLLFYFMLRGGLVALVPASAKELDPPVLAGVGGLVGLFSKNALEKLREVFNVVFRTEQDRPAPKGGAGKTPA